MPAKKKPKKTAKRKPKPKSKAKPEHAEAPPPDPTADALRRLQEDAARRRLECGKVISETLERFGCELVPAPPLSLVIDERGQQVNCNFDVKAKLPQG